jgi:hypothetical protein
VIRAPEVRHAARHRRCCARDSRCRFSQCRPANGALTVKHSSIYGLFICAVALFAAVLGDAVVEGISNAGILWHGNYTDGSSLDLVPVFLLAVTALVLMQGFALLEHARQTGLSMRAVILSTSRALTPRDVARLLPVIFALQIVVLFGMETIEQIVVYGHAFGGAIWLGGPVVVSLMIHALCGVAAAFSISNAVGAIGDALTRIVTCIFARFVACARSAVVLSRRRIFFALALIVTASLVERGPPLSVATG